MVSEKNGKNGEIYTVSVSDSLPQKKAEGQKNFWHIDKEMLRFKLHYFLFTLAFGNCIPYLTVFAQKRVGITASALGAMLTSQRCIMIFAKPAMGYLSDYFKKLNVIIFALSVVTTVSLLVLLSVPKIENGTEKRVTLDNLKNNSTYHEIMNTSEAYIVCDIHQDDNFWFGINLFLNNSKNDNICTQSLLNLSNFLKKCSDNTKNDTEQEGERNVYSIVTEQKYNALSNLSNSFLCKICCKFTEKCQIIECVDVKASTTEVSVEEKPTSDFQKYQFWLFAFISTIAIVSVNNFFTLTDTACCETVQKTGAQFGRQCLWGAIGWGLISPLSGLLNDYTGDFMASWILMAFMALIAMLNLTRLKIAKPEFSKNLLKDIGTVLSSKEFLAFKFCVIMNGVGTGMVWFYLFIFLTDIGASRFQCGMALLFQGVFGLIPFMFFSGWIIKKIGHFNCLTLSLAAYTIKFFWYSQMRNPWFALPAEILQGITEGLFYANFASFAKLSSKPGTEATTQGVLSTAHEGIGIGIGCVVCGIGFDSIGSHRTLLYVSIYYGCATILSIILHSLVRRQKCNINVTSPEKA